MAEVWDVQQLKLIWETRRDAPHEMKRGAAVAHGSVGYFSSYLSQDVFAYDSEKDDWSKLPECPQSGFGLAVIDNLLTAVGGWQNGLFSGGYTNRLVSFSGSKWVSVFPPMPTKRRNLAVISAQNYLITTGGLREGRDLSTVEVMNIATREWYTAASLPEPVFDMTATICGGRLYLLGGYSTHVVFTRTLDSLLHSCHPPSQPPPHTNEAGVWQRIADVPMQRSTCTTLNGRVLAVCGKDSHHTPTADVYMYNADSDSWPLVGHMSTDRSQCLVVGLRDCIIAVGGFHSAVEVGYLQLSDTAEERHLAALELAIRQKGSLDKTIMQCVFVGVPRSGKSTLMKRMVGERPTRSSPSTGVVDKVVQVEIVRSSTSAATVSSSTWVKLSHDDEAVTVVMDTAQSHSGEVADSDTYSQASVAVAAVHQTEPNSATSGGRVSEQPQPDGVSEHRSRHQPHQSPTPTTASTHPHLPSQSSSVSSNTADLKPSVDMCKSALRRTPYRASQEQGWMVYLTDTGGQIEFQELLPLLVSGPSVFFLVFRLDHDLNKRFTVVYVRPNGTMSEPYQSNFTVKEALLQTLASIASIESTETQVFFVGTHMDKVSRAKIDHIDCSLRQMVTSTGLYREGMIQFASESRMLLAVNNLSDDDSDIQQVRAAVERLGSRGSFKVTAPPSWLIFSLTIRQNKDQVLSYEQCFEVARQCGITSRRELNEALWFLHTKVGLIRHFQGDGLEDLQKIVIQDPQVLFDRITDLVVETFTFDKARQAGSFLEDFKIKGIFPFSTFEKISATSDLLTSSRLVKLLEHLHIIAPLEKEDGEEGEEEERRYFMPCILAHAQPGEPTSRFERISRAFTDLFRRSAEQSHDNSSLLVGFRCGYCPKGLFAALVVYLLANARSHGHKWSLQIDQIFKDQVSFLVRPYDTVSITVQPKFFEITCTSAVSKLSHNRSFPLATTCGEVRRCIETGIREVTSALHYTSDTAHYLAFYCPGKHRGPDPKEPHPAEINFHDNKPCTLQCVVDKRGTFELPSGHERWFTELSECSGRQEQEKRSQRKTGLESVDDTGVLDEMRLPSSATNKANQLGIQFIDPVEIISCDTLGCDYYNPRHDVEVRIPKGAILPSEGMINIEFGVAMYGPFRLSDGRSVRRVSPVVWLCVQQNGFSGFQKNVEITIPHFLHFSTKDANTYLRFLKADHQLDEDGEIQLQPADGRAVFDHATYGILLTRHFCSTCIATSVFPSEHTRYYLGGAISSKGQDMQIIFFVCYFLKSCIRTVKQQLDKDSKEIYPQVFTFADGKKLKIKTPNAAPDWLLAMESSNEISATEVDFHSMSGEDLQLQEDQKLYPPRFVITVRGSTTAKDSHTVFAFTGATDKFVKEIILTKAISSPTPPPFSSIVYPRIGLESVDSTTMLGEDDLRDVRSAVADLAGRWEDLGISLGVRPGDLDAILSASAHSPSSCLKKMLLLWLRQSYNVERFGKPTWRRLVEAVEDHVGGNNRALAQAIAAEHPGEQPTLIELIRFRGRERRINIPQQIGANFMKFGIILLEDTNGARMQSITHECRDSPEQINTKVLQEWIAGRGRLPVSWDTLVEVLHDVDLGTLADDIAAVKCS